MKRLWKNFRDRKFNRSIKSERSKKYLYQAPVHSTGKLFEVYHRARRGAYFRPIYSAFTRNKNSFYLSFTIIGIVLISLSAYITVLSPYFRISPSKVIIERTDTLSDINIAYKAIEPIYNTSIWTLDKNEITRLIRDLEKNINTVETTLLLPDGLKIIVRSHPPVFSVKFPGLGREYLLSSNGVLIPNRSGEGEFARLKIYSNELIESSFLDYKEAVSPEHMERILGILTAMKSDFPQLVITSILYYVVENELHLVLENGTRIHLVLDNSADKQLLGLKFTSEQTPGLLTNGENMYVDSRIIGKVFVCKNKELCQKNLEKIYGTPAY